MRNLTIKYKNRFWNYDNIEGFNFEDPDWMTVYGVDGRWDIPFNNKEEWEYAKQKFEEGLINNYVFIDLEKHDD